MSDPTPNKPAEADPKLSAHPASILREVSLIFVLILLLVLGCVLLGNVVPLIKQNLYALVASIFVGVPYFWLRHTDADFDRFGLTYAGARRGILWGLLFSALTLVPFTIGYGWWQQNFLGNQLDFSTDNFYQWPLELEGRPPDWDLESNADTKTPTDDAQKAWVWKQDSTLHIGLAAGAAPVDLYLQADTAISPVIRGPAALVKGHENTKSDLNRATIRLEQPNARSEVIFRHRENRPIPRSLKIQAKNLDSGDTIPVLQGPRQAPSDAPLGVDRGLNWLILWLLTELMFIALPEEFFYRGYLLTRLKQFFDARASAKHPADSSTQDSPRKRRRFLGISAENLVVSLLFAVGHVLIPIGGVLMISRAAVFFPSLAFGWLRERTDSIVAPVVYHAAANMMVLLAAPHFF